MTRAALLLLAACATTPPSPPVVVDGCALERPPPAFPKAAPVACPGYASCFTRDDSAALLAWSAEARDWMAVAWGRCAARSPADAKP